MVLRCSFTLGLVGGACFWGFRQYFGVILVVCSSLGDWANPKEELEQIFNAVKDLKPELYKEVQIDF